MSRASALACALLGAAALAGPAAAAGPPNDAPAHAGAFAEVTAENGTPTERQAIVTLDGAGPDPGVPRCLGPASFARTAWLRIESTATTRRLRIDASGSSTRAPDLAAFVQPAGALDPVVGAAQACDGRGGPADLGGEGGASLELRVAPGQQVLVQVGRRDADPAEDVLVTLAATVLAPRDAPAGDLPADALALAGAPVALAGATLGAGEPTTARCPATGVIWRRVAAAPAGPQRIVATGGAETVAAFAGAQPPADAALGCANRTRSAAPVELTVDAPAGQPLWIALGADRADAAPATVTVSSAAPAGGGGGGGGSSADPGSPATPGTPAPPAPAGAPGGGTGSAPSTSTACRGRLTATVTSADRPRRRLRGTAGAGACRVARVEVRLRPRDCRRCNATRWLRASGAARWTLRLPRGLDAGRYRIRLRVTAADGRRARIAAGPLLVPRPSSRIR